MARPGNDLPHDQAAPETNSLRRSCSWRRERYGAPPSAPCRCKEPVGARDIITIERKAKAMQPIKTTWQFVLTLAFAGVVLSGAGGQIQTTPNAEEQLAPLIRSIKGPDLFRAYCASCHGLDAKGAGPVAPSLKATVPDLTLLERNNRGQFPAARVRKIIVGDEVVAAHGSREMPIWGPTFHQVEGDMDWGNVRLENLVKYLESIQSTRGSKAPSGAELHK
jgi:mono/diheme cytochrome c family protein